MIRDFMPGECTIGPKAEAFLELDRSPGADPRVVEMAKSACRACVQLPHCETQRSGIAEVLGVRGVEDKTVIGGELVQAPQPAEPTAAELLEPAFQFDLSVVPPTPRQQLEIIRQAFRSRQLSARGKKTVQQDELSSRLEEKLVETKDQLNLNVDETRAVSQMVSRIVLRYRKAKHDDWSVNKLRLPLTGEEKIEAEALQDVFVEDVLVLKQAGFKEPETLAPHHKPVFYTKTMQVYSQSFDISFGKIRNLLQSYPSDPVSAIEREVARQRQHKEAAKTGFRNKDADTVPEDLLRATKVKKLIKEHSTSMMVYYRHLPELKKYIGTVYRNNLIDPSAEIKALYHTVTGLKKEHPSVEPTVLIHLAYYQRENMNEAIATYKTVHAELHKKYADYSDLGPERLNRFSFTHLAGAHEAVQSYLGRISELKSICKETDVSIDDHFLRSIADKYSRELSAQEIAQLYEKYQLQSSVGRRLPGIEGWMVSKILQLYDKERVEEILAYISQFRTRSYLTVAHEKMRQESTTPYDRVDSKKGSYLTLDDEFSYFSSQEQEAILGTYGLDRIVLGYDVDTDELRTFFKVDNLTQFVDENLLPHTRYGGSAKPSKDPQEILECVRRWNRDTSSKATTLKPEERVKVNAVLGRLITFLQAKELSSHNLESKEVQGALRLMVRRVMQNKSQVLSPKETLEKVALVYLNEVEIIKSFGINNAYLVGLASSSKFCKNFMERAKREMPDSPPSYLRRILERSTSDQAVLRFRRYRELINDMSPEFQKRGIPLSYCRRICLSNVLSEEKIKAKLLIYDKLNKKYGNKLDVPKDALYYFCLERDEKDSMQNIEDWRKNVKEIDDYYKQHVDIYFIRLNAYSKRGAELTAFLDDSIEQVARYQELYKDAPPGAIDNEVIKHAVYKRSNTAQWLSNYLTRWKKVREEIDVSDIDPHVFRRLMTIHTIRPVEAVGRYYELNKKFDNDLYIQSWMIDDAIKWSINGAFRSLERMRNILRKTRISLDGTTHGSEQQNHERIADRIPTPEDIVTGSDEKEFLVSRISTVLKDAEPIEKAAIAEVYDLPWLVPEEFEDATDKVYAFYDVQTVDELQVVVGKILARMA